MKIKEKINTVFFNTLLIVLYSITAIIPRPVFVWMFEELVECEVCKRKMYRRRGWRKRYPQELLDLQIKCEDCCSPEEIEERERLADKYTHIIQGDSYAKL
jgi:hypothetical protein